MEKLCFQINEIFQLNLFCNVDNNIKLFNNTVNKDYITQYQFPGFPLRGARLVQKNQKL